LRAFADRLGKHKAWRKRLTLVHSLAIQGIGAMCCLPSGLTRALLVLKASGRAERDLAGFVYAFLPS
jgi:hypothetical protein